MKLRKSKIFVTLLLSLSMFVCSCLPAQAYTYTSTTGWRYITGYGNFAYQYRARYRITNTLAKSIAEIERRNGGPMAAGYVYANALLYIPGGFLVKTSGFIELGYSSSSYSVNASTTNSGTYYAQGCFQIYSDNINGNREYALCFSEITDAKEFTPRSISDSLGSYKVNSNGETYGSGLLAQTYGEFPDLISAEGTNGNHGYIRQDDLLSFVSAEDEVNIPVYDLDGNVIDTFEFSNVSDDEIVEIEPIN